MRDPGVAHFAVSVLKEGLEALAEQPRQDEGKDREVDEREKERRVVVRLARAVVPAHPVFDDRAGFAVVAAAVSAMGSGAMSHFVVTGFVAAGEKAAAARSGGVVRTSRLGVVRRARVGPLRHGQAASGRQPQAAHQPGGGSRRRRKPVAGWAPLAWGPPGGQAGGNRPPWHRYRCAAAGVPGCRQALLVEPGEGGSP